MTDDIDRRQWLKAIGAAGMAATVPLAGCAGSSDAGGGDGGSGGDGGGSTPTPTSGGGSGSGGENWTETSTVDMTDDLTFAPKRIQVSSGTTVTWENVGSIGHTVTAYEDGIPDGAEYFASGGFGSEQAARDGYPDKGNITEGGTYEHTFETKGTYKYFCVPHEMNGMIGYVKVV